ncbi:MAG: hypothetical protein KAS32_17075 [Candidatus Peribacteraceae bacterium]|nr:hypothetical protein [Candidatus Peribacteraceae bacterium]
MKISKISQLALIVVATPFVMGYSQEAHAASVTVTQQSEINLYGEWKLNTPNKIASGEKRTQTVNNTSLGNYKINVEPPYNASITRIRFEVNGKEIKTVTGKNAVFQINENVDLQILISYEYDGEITISGNPSGNTFEITSLPGMRWTGITPTKLTNMPPMEYTIHYGQVDNCQLPEPQRGKIRLDIKEIRFDGKYICGNAMNKENTKKEEKTNLQKINQTVPTPERSEVINVRLWNAFHQKEGLAGTTVLVTIGVRNVGKETLRNVSITESFNEEKVSIPKAIPKNGYLAQRGVIGWNIPSIYAGQSWTTTIPVTLNSQLSSGEQVNLISRVSAENIRATRGELLTKTTSIGIATLPETGEGAEKIIFMLLIIGASLILASETFRRKSVALRAF